ncbi:MAG: hypothetical protein COB17_11245, partial [Sulfurimonas sp.]
TITNSGDTNITAFSLSDSTNFEINASGYIKTKTALDYETNTTYSLEVNATNTAGDSANKTVTININNIGDFYIKSAVYYNNNTLSVLDDKLYVYFDQSIKQSSIAADMSINYSLQGTGVIGTASASDYNDTFFYQHIISFDSTSTALVVNDTNISIASSVLQDASGNYTSYDTNKTTVEKFRIVLKTGQTTSYVANDDGTYQSGKTRSYTDNANGTVTDNDTGLIWQKEDDNATYTWANAITYCNGLTLGGSTSWRLPTIEELVLLSDKGRSNPSIDPVFTNTNSSYYWSSSTVVATTNLGIVSFLNGNDAANNKTNNNYVRCVR